MLSLGIKEGGTLGVAQAGQGTGGGSFGGADETLGLGNKLIFDDDADTYIYASQDDRLKFFTGALERFEIFGANVDIANNTNLRPATAGGSTLGGSLRGWGDTYIDQGKKVYLDDDADSYVFANSDDVVRMHAGAATSYVELATSTLSVVVANATHLSVAAAGVSIRDRLVPVAGTPTIGDSGASEGFGGLYLQDLGAYTAAVSEVQPATPNDGHVIFSASTSTGVRELWALDDAGTSTKIL